MTQVLQVNSSLFGEHGQSSQLTARFVERFSASHAEADVYVRDLASEPVPHLDAETVAGFGLPEAERNEVQKIRTELSDRLIEELREADVLVLGLPMYNFSLPSTLKAWFDYIARAGITFKYTEQGPVGLLQGKKAYVLAARGGLYQGTEYDTQTSLVRQFLGFIGITDVEFVYAEGLNMGDNSKERALEEAKETIEKMVA